jgi:hypothetical protein
MKHKPNTKILFILKRKLGYDIYADSYVGMSSGLYNSASFMNDMLNNCGIESNISVVVDNNEIDKEVTEYKPTHVIIEALWVVPTKFLVLEKLHPNVKWIIRLHSELPFLSNEGMALNWIGDYAHFKNVFIGTNAPRATEEIRDFLSCKLGLSKRKIKDRVIYLPNFYPQEFKNKKFNREKDTIDISCFGAIRPLKNHMMQAIAAIKFANKIGKKLNFHINSNRIEQKGEPVYHNLIHLFSHLHESGHKLVNHEWLPREEFLEICSKMDISMQVSFSETFNIVAADHVSQGVPLVGAYEIPWNDDIFSANPTESHEIYEKLMLTYYFPLFNIYSNQYLLKRYTNKTRKIWVEVFNKNY